MAAVFFLSDGTHLSNFANDKKEWPVHMTIGNLFSKIRPMPSMQSVVMVALLPIPFKHRKIAQKRLHDQRQTHRKVQNKEIWRLLQSHTVKPNPCTESGY
jgi:hypothetical protein